MARRVVRRCTGGGFHNSVGVSLETRSIVHSDRIQTAHLSVTGRATLAPKLYDLLKACGRFIDIKLTSICHCDVNVLK